MTKREYEELLATEELRHPLLASLRLHIHSKPQKSELEAIVTEHSQTQSDNILSAVVVEAEPSTFTNIPDDSVEAIHGMFAGSAQTSERLAAVPLDKLRPSPFYNILADGKRVEKALTLLRFTQRTNGKNHLHGFRKLLCHSGAVHDRESPGFCRREGCCSNGRDLQGRCTVQTSTARSRSLYRGHGTCPET